MVYSAHRRVSDLPIYANARGSRSKNRQGSRTQISRLCPQIRRTTRQTRPTCLLTSSSSSSSSSSVVAPIFARPDGFPNRGHLSLSPLAHVAYEACCLETETRSRFGVKRRLSQRYLESVLQAILGQPKEQPLEEQPLEEPKKKAKRKRERKRKRKVQFFRVHHAKES